MHKHFLARLALALAAPLGAWAQSPIDIAPPRQTSSAAVSGAPAGGANAFNPAMSLILSGLYTRTS